MKVKASGLLSSLLWENTTLNWLRRNTRELFRQIVISVNKNLIQNANHRTNIYMLHIDDTTRSYRFKGSKYFRLLDAFYFEFCY